MKDIEKILAGWGTVKDQQKENLLYELNVITLMPVDDIEKFCNDNKLPLLYLKDWYLGMAEIPTAAQCNFIGPMSYNLFRWYLSRKMAIKHSSLKPSTLNKS